VAGPVCYSASSVREVELFERRSLVIWIFNFFLIVLVGGVVQLVPLGTAATDRPIVPAPVYYDDGENSSLQA
jgi:hypothetical protein